jgi:succinyl-CoA synthetase alpha subunit
VPVLDMTRVRPYVREKGARLLGPNCPGLLSPGKSKVGIIPGHITQPGPVGLVSRSGTLTYEVVFKLKQAGLGTTTCVGIGGDPINGTDFIDCLAAFEADPETDLIVLIGEIGGDAEERAAAYIRDRVTKPVVGYIAGFTAPEGRTMGHAGAIVSGSTGTARAKKAALEAVGVPVGGTPTKTAGLVVGVLGGA